MNEWTLGIVGGTEYLGSSLVRHLGKSFDCSNLSVIFKNNMMDVGTHMASVLQKPVY